MANDGWTSPACWKGGSSPLGNCRGTFFSAHRSGDQTVVAMVVTIEMLIIAIIAMVTVVTMVTRVMLWRHNVMTSIMLHHNSITSSYLVSSCNLAKSNKNWLSRSLTWQPLPW